MKTTKDSDNLKSSLPTENDSARLSGRDQYLLEAERIREQIGDLPQILQKLGINQRRACQLLLVDPSAWTRWMKTGAPPHIYQALKWLIELKKTNPAVTGPIDLATRLDRLQMSTQEKLQKLEQGLTMLERAMAYTPAPSTFTDIVQNDGARALQASLIEERREHLKTIADLETKLRAKSATKKTRKSKLKKPQGTAAKKLKAKKAKAKKSKIKQSKKKIVRFAKAGTDKKSKKKRAVMKHRALRK